MIGPPVPHVDHVPAIRSRAPFSRYASVSDSGRTRRDGRAVGLPDRRDRPRPGAVPGPVPPRGPGAEERERAARRLDAAGASPPEQRLLSVLLDDDRQASDEAPADRPVEHREGVGAGPEPRSLPPVGLLTRATPASPANGWRVGVRSGCPPEAVLRMPRRYA